MIKKIAEGTAPGQLKLFTRITIAWPRIHSRNWIDPQNVFDLFIKSMNRDSRYKIIWVHDSGIAMPEQKTHVIIDRVVDAELLAEKFEASLPENRTVVTFWVSYLGSTLK